MRRACVLRLNQNELIPPVERHLAIPLQPEDDALMDEKMKEAWTRFIRTVMVNYLDTDDIRVTGGDAEESDPGEFVFDVHHPSGEAYWSYKIARQQSEAFPIVPGSMLWPYDEEVLQVAVVDVDALPAEYRPS